MANKFLDSNGVTILFSKVKDWVDDQGFMKTGSITGFVPTNKVIKSSMAGSLSELEDYAYDDYVVSGASLESIIRDELDSYLTKSSASSSYQPKDSDLTAIAGLTGTKGFLKKNGDGLWSLDTNTYLTSHQSLSGYAKESWVNTQISNLVNSAPETLNTLGELATALKNHEDAYGALLTTVGGKLDKSGGSLDNSATLKFTTFGTRTVTISGNSIDADMSADTGTWAGNFATVKHSKGTTTMLGWYGSKTDGLYSIFMGGSYSDPAMKMDASGNFTFKNTITGTITNATQLGGVAASSYATTSALSNYMPLSGGTFTGVIKTIENAMGLKLRTHTNYETGWVYGTSGNEAITLAMQNPVTAFQIVYGTKPSEFSSSTWQSVTPLFQTKDGKVIINRKITVSSETTNLKLFDVNGDANATTLYENGTALSNKYQPKGDYLTSIPTASSSVLGGVKIVDEDLYGKTGGNGYAAGVDHSHSNYAVVEHSSLNGTYGFGTTSLYGHVKLQTGDMNGTTNTNGIAAGLGHTHSNYLPKTTYEYNKEIAFGSTGKLYIGAFPMYDSNITIEISATTSTTYNATLVIATQNINTTGGGSLTATVYGDATNTIAPNIYIGYASGSNQIHVYFSPQSWSKNLIHIQAVALAGAPSNVCTSVDSIPSTANRQPTNALTANFQAKGDYLTKTTADGTYQAKGTYITPTTGSEYYPKYIQTRLQNKTSWYGAQYPIYAWWETNSICKWVVDNYETKVDIAVKDASGNTITSYYQPKLVSGTNIKTINGTSLLGNGNINLINGNSALYWSGRTKLSSLVSTLSNASSEGALVLVRVDNGWDKYGWIMGRYDDGNYDEGRFFQGFISDIYGSIEQVSFVLYYGTVQHNSHSSLDATEIYVIGG